MWLEASGARSCNGTRQNTPWPDSYASQTVMYRCALQDELQTNPFLRPTEPALQAYTGEKDPVQVLGALRKKKDKF